jgi:hypothetical protein
LIPSLLMASSRQLKGEYLLKLQKKHQAATIHGAFLKFEVLESNQKANTAKTAPLGNRISKLVAAPLKGGDRRSGHGSHFRLVIISNTILKTTKVQLRPSLGGDSKPATRQMAEG